MLDTIVKSFGYVLIAASIVSAYVDGQCRAHRDCMFGTEAKYDAILDYMIEKTGCTSCKTNTTCTCDPAGSVIEGNITAQLWCNGNAICTDPRSHFVMSYPTDNIPCEAPFRDMQEFFIQLCGSVGGVCCDGNCTQDFHITQPRMPCEGKAGSKPRTRWIVSAYLVSSLVLAQWGMAAKSFV